MFGTMRNGTGFRIKLAFSKLMGNPALGLYVGASFGKPKVPKLNAKQCTPTDAHPAISHELPTSSGATKDMFCLIALIAVNFIPLAAPASVRELVPSI